MAAIVCAFSRDQDKIDLLDAKMEKIGESSRLVVRQFMVFNYIIESNLNIF
jgi:hypothetical protein